jgi:hypothetical protein
MKPFWKFVAVGAVSCGLTACDKGDKPEAGESAAPEAAAAEGEAEPAEAPGLDPAQRAEMLGFAGKLAGDVEFLATILNGRQLVNGFRSLKAWELAEEVAEEEEGVDLEAEVSEQAALADSLLGEEMFLALGDGSTDVLEAYGKFSEEMSYYQFRAFAREFAKAAVSGEFDQLLMKVMMADWAGDFGSDAGKFIPDLEAFEVPPVLAGLKISDDDARAMAEEQVRSVLMMLDADAEPIEFESVGAEFSGIVINGESMAAEMEADRAEMDAEIGEENTDRVIAAVRVKQLVVALGRVDDYLLLFAGGDAEDCPMVDEVGDSLVADERIAFIDEFEGQAVHGLLFGDEEMVAKLPRGGIDRIAEGISDGINGVEGFGDTRELVALLELVGERENALTSLFTPDTFGGVIRVDDGLYFETFGGGDSGLFDFETPHALGGLGSGEEVLLFSNWRTNELYSRVANEYGEALIETAYAFAAHLAAMEIGSESFEEFSAGFGLFDELLRENLVEMWSALDTMSDGLGRESALVVDLAAAFPPIPGVPPAAVEESRFIRASYISPVTDRTKLADSWERLNESMRGIFRSLSEAGLADISMLTPTSSEKDELTTWYFDAFAFSDDLKPSVTLDDDWFIASTSRNQALDLREAIESGTGSDRKGYWLRFDMDVLRKYLDEALTVADDKGELLMPDERSLEEFREELPRLREAVASLEDLREITIHDRMVDGRRRVTLHFAQP